MRSVEVLARVTSPTLRRFAGALRRMTISVTSKPLWQVIGYRQPDGGDETAFAELFPGVGFYSRPPASGAPEAVVAYVGGATHPVLIATRDEKTRARVAAIGEDEAIVYATAAVVHVRANGTVEVRRPSGQAVALATKADVESLANWVSRHAHSGGTGSGGVTGPPAGDSPPSPSGTSVLRGE